ncbi:MAG: DALR anticodon-binding domain-containing protein, partial [Candidatus Micrarchaeia archaeon]
IVFSWDNALNLEANSGPYVMYMHARAKRIIEKGEYARQPPADADYAGIGRGSGFELIKSIGAAPDVVASSCFSYRPNILADYLLDLATRFSEFYEKEPVLKGGSAKNARLAIVYAAMQTAENLMRLMGIEPTEAI